ncbi:hypothetical protein BLNAU_15738 [Blattamonas nauphoetae]|uniref:B30.2/SPRY domain-containing protein n=1 Tax=Blattamonas nauphoetae TaxID=2049346 RepID=A0ABQ9X9Z6_9EUKA|nr:hypothetical protein BLNAU_15738 [Blattamonas nauphoetae]
MKSTPLSIDSVLTELTRSGSNVSAIVNTRDWNAIPLLIREWDGSDEATMLRLLDEMFRILLVLSDSEHPLSNKRHLHSTLSALSQTPSLTKKILTRVRLCVTLLESVHDESLIIVTTTEIDELKKETEKGERGQGDELTPTTLTQIIATPNNNPWITSFTVPIDEGEWELKIRTRKRESGSILGFLKHPLPENATRRHCGWWLNGIGGDFTLWDGRMWKEREFKPEGTNKKCDRIGQTAAIRVNMWKREARLFVNDSEQPGIFTDIPSPLCLGISMPFFLVDLQSQDFSFDSPTSNTPLSIDSVLTELTRSGSNVSAIVNTRDWNAIPLLIREWDGSDEATMLRLLDEMFRILLVLSDSEHPLSNKRHLHSTLSALSQTPDHSDQIRGRVQNCITRLESVEEGPLTVLTIGELDQMKKEWDEVNEERKKRETEISVLIRIKEDLKRQLFVLPIWVGTTSLQTLDQTAHTLTPTTLTQIIKLEGKCWRTAFTHSINEGEWELIVACENRTCCSNRTNVLVHHNGDPSLVWCPSAHKFVNFDDF